MRIIHDLENPCQVIAGARDNDVYSKMRGEEISNGFPVSALICTKAPFSDVEEAIHIEGNAVYVLDALETVCKMIRETGDDFVKAGKLSPDWASMQVARARNAEHKAKGKLPRRRRTVELDLAEGWVATEIEATQGRPEVTVFMFRVENKADTRAAAYFDTKEYKFTTYPGDFAKRLHTSEEVSYALMTEISVGGADSLLRFTECVE